MAIYSIIPAGHKSLRTTKNLLREWTWLSVPASADHRIYVARQDKDGLLVHMML